MQSVIEEQIDKLYECKKKYGNECASIDESVEFITTIIPSLLMIKKIDIGIDFGGGNGMMYFSKDMDPETATNAAARDDQLFNAIELILRRIRDNKRTLRRELTKDLLDTVVKYGNRILTEAKEEIASNLEIKEGGK